MDGQGQDSDEKYWYGIASKLVDTNNKLIDIVAKQSSHHHHHHHHKHWAKSLSADYFTIQNGDILIINSKTSNQMAQTVTVLGTQNTLPGQIVPVAADNVTVEPISTIQAGSEAYTVVDQATGQTSLVATVAAVAGGAEGQFAVSRIGTQSGTVLVSYTALAADGVTTITNVGGVPDTIIFQGQPTGVAAALTAQYGQASAKK
jgi:hypothetical protein